MTRLKPILSILIGLILAFSAFGAYEYINTEKNSEGMKEDIEVEIIDPDVKSVDENPEQEMEEEIEEEVIEGDVEQVEAIEDRDETNGESPESEEVVETLSETPAILPAPSKIRDNPDELRIGFITDLHVRSNLDKAGKRIIKPALASKLNYFIERMNNVFVPNFVLANGDIIEGTNISSEKGMRELSAVKDLFNRSTLKKYWVIGNHDLRSVTKGQFMQSLDIDYTSKAFEVGNYKIIILDSNFRPNDSDVVPGKAFTRGHVSKKQIKFLEKELKNTKKRTVVFVHHPMIQGTNGKPFPDNAQELQEIFSENKVFAVFAGHIEDLYLQEIEGVKYFISPGILKHEKYQGAFSEIIIKKNKMVVDMSYLKSDGSYRTIRINED